MPGITPSTIAYAIIRVDRAVQDENRLKKTQELPRDYLGRATLVAYRKDCVGETAALVQEGDMRIWERFCAAFMLGG